MALLDGSVVQSAGTDAWNTLPPLTALNSADGFARGCPGVPTACVGSPAGSVVFAFASSAIDFAGGSAANVVFIGWNWLASAGLAIVRASASLLMYCVRLPGSGWLLNHCGAPLPLLPAAFAIVSNMCARARGS